MRAISCACCIAHGPTAKQDFISRLTSRIIVRAVHPSTMCSTLKYCQCAAFAFPLRYQIVNRKFDFVGHKWWPDTKETHITNSLLSFRCHLFDSDSTDFLFSILLISHQAKSLLRGKRSHLINGNTPASAFHQSEIIAL